MSKSAENRFPPPHRRASIRHLWGASILGTVLWYPFLTGFAMAYAAAVVRDLARAKRDSNRAGLACAVAALAFDVGMVVLGGTIYLTNPGSLDWGLVPFGPFTALVLPALHAAGIL